MTPHGCLSAGRPPRDRGPPVSPVRCPVGAAIDPDPMPGSLAVADSGVNLDRSFRTLRYAR